MRDRSKIIYNALEPPYSNARLEATNNLIKVIKRNAFGFRSFENFKTRILIALNIKKREDQFGPLQVVAFHQPTAVDKEPINQGKPSAAAFSPSVGDVAVVSFFGFPYDSTTPPLEMELAIEASAL